MLLRNFLFLFLSLLTITFIQAQNLVPNPGFEDNTLLPDDDCLWHYVESWTNVNGDQACENTVASPDYYHVLGTGFANLPLSLNGEVLPFEGDAVMGIATRITGVQNFREYISVELTEPLKVGVAYIGSFYHTNGTKGVHNSGWGGYGSHLGMHFSVGPMIQNNREPILVQQPDPIYETVGSVYDEVWFENQFIFASAQEYTHITIGNFRDDDNTEYLQYHPDPSGNGYAYYFIDQVSVTEASVLPLSLLSFSAESLQEGVALSWETDQLEANTHFFLEKSKDGKRFDPFLEKYGEEQEQFFQAVDYTPEQGVNYYRIRYELLDGLQGFSNVLQVKYQAHRQWEIGPSPLSNTKILGIQYEGEDIQKASVQLMNTQGAIVRQKEMIFDKKQSWDLQGIPAGIYFLRIETSEKAFHQSIIIPQ